MAAELFQKAPFVEMSQFLQEHGIADLNLQHAAAQAADAGLPGPFRPGGPGPGIFQAQPFLPPAPAARGEQAAEDFANGLGAFVHDFSIAAHVSASAKPHAAQVKGITTYE
jgi:hypothetical protein